MYRNSPLSSTALLLTVVSLTSDDDFRIVLTDVHVPIFDNVLSHSNIMGIPLPAWQNYWAVH